MKTVSKMKRHPRKAPRVSAGRVLGSRIQELREKHDLTLRAISAACGVPTTTLLRMQYGRECELSSALKLAKFFETPVEEIFSL